MKVKMVTFTDVLYSLDQFNIRKESYLSNRKPKEKDNFGIAETRGFKIKTVRDSSFQNNCDTSNNKMSNNEVQYDSRYKSE